VLSLFSTIPSAVRGMQLCSFEGILNHILFPQDVSCSYEGAPMLLQKIRSPQLQCRTSQCSV